jgi:hypothetical protein
MSAGRMIYLAAAAVYLATQATAAEFRCVCVASGGSLRMPLLRLDMVKTRMFYARKKLAELVASA